MTPLANRPDYAAAVDDVNKLAAARAKIDSRLAEIDVLSAQPSAEQLEVSAVEAALSFSATGVVVQHANDPLSLDRERRVLLEQRSALDQAIAKVHEDMGLIQQRASADVCAELVTAHKRIAEQALQALLAFNKAQVAEFELMRSIEEAGYSAQFRQMVRWPYVGMLEQRSESVLWHQVKELCSYTDQPFDF